MHTVLGHRLDLLTGKELPVVMARVSVTTGPEEGLFVLVKLGEVSSLVKVDSNLKLPPYPICLPVVVNHVRGISAPLIVEIADNERALGRNGSRRGTFYEVLEQHS